MLLRNETRSIEISLRGFIGEEEIGLQEVSTRHTTLHDCVKIIFEYVQIENFFYLELDAEFVNSNTN